MKELKCGAIITISSGAIEIWRRWDCTSTYYDRLKTGYHSIDRLNRVLNSYRFEVEIWHYQTQYINRDGSKHRPRKKGNQT